MPTLPDKFRGCLVGSVIGDVAGAVVEAESAEYIAGAFGSVDEILAIQTVREFAAPAWRVGKFTDDSQMMICVAEWLLEGKPHLPERLLARFAQAYEPWRRYGPGTAGILQAFPKCGGEWRGLTTGMFPHGSHGNGSAMRVGPVGLAYYDDPAAAASLAMESSRPTHSHSLAYQGAVMQSLAVATAAGLSEFSPGAFLRPIRAGLARFADLMQDTSKFERALETIEAGIGRGTSCMEMSATLGTGVTAYEAVPMALYCFLRHPDSYARVIHEAIFIGGDTDTIASMAGAISGAFLGATAIPRHWRDAVREEKYSVAAIESLADRLFEKFAERCS